MPRTVIGRRRFTALAAGFAAAGFATGGLAAGGITSAQAATPLPVIIGMQTDPDWLTIAAQKLQLYEKAGLKPTYLKFTSGAPMMAAAMGGSINIAAPGLVPFVSGIAAGIPWVAIGIDNAGPRAEAIVVRDGAGIHTLADLKGKRIGYTRGSTPQYVLSQVLQREHIALDEVTLLVLTPEQQVAAMRLGNIDAADVWEPWVHTLTAYAHGKVLATDKSLGISVFGGVYAVRRDWLAAHRETAKRFIQAIVLAADAVAQDSLPIIQTFATETGITEAWSTDIFKEAPPSDPRHWLDPATDLSMAPDGQLEHGLTELAGFLLRQKIVQAPIDVSHAIDRSVVADVLKSDHSP